MALNRDTDVRGGRRLRRALVLMAAAGALALIPAGPVWADSGGSGGGHGNSANAPGQVKKQDGSGASQTASGSSAQPGNSDHAEGNSGTSGQYDQPQPAGNADRNGGGANGQCPGGAYCSTRDGSASGNGNQVQGGHTGEPCAGCVGRADNKNPKGQMPNGSDQNAGYECDRNHGIGRTNPAHTGCQNVSASSVQTPQCSTGCSSCTGSGCGTGMAICTQACAGSESQGALVETGALSDTAAESAGHPNRPSLSGVVGERFSRSLRSQLPFTGFNAASWVAAGAALVLAGGALSRRRRRYVGRHRA